MKTENISNINLEAFNSFWDASPDRVNPFREALKEVAFNSFWDAS